MPVGLVMLLSSRTGGWATSLAAFAKIRRLSVRDTSVFALVVRISSPDPKSALVSKAQKTVWIRTFCHLKIPLCLVALCR